MSVTMRIAQQRPWRRCTVHLRALNLLKDYPSISRLEVNGDHKRTVVDPLWLLILVFLLHLCLSRICWDWFQISSSLSLGVVITYFFEIYWGKVCCHPSNDCVWYLGVVKLFIVDPKCWIRKEWKHFAITLIQMLD